MSVTYTVSEHPLLSVKAKELAKKDDVFAEQVALAAGLLGVDETVYAGDTLTKINRAIVLQINYQLLLEPAVFLNKSAASSHSKQTIVYRGGDNGPPLVLSQAQVIVDAVNAELAHVGSGWDNIKAVR